MGPSLILLLMIVAGVMLWLDGARARELATEIARRYCENRGLQFLDETVAQARMGLRWTREGLRVRRMFRFEFSLEGVGRRTGHVLMLGSRFETLDDGLPRAAQEAEPGPDPARPDAHDPKVIPFRRRRD